MILVVDHARIVIKDICFIALTLAWSLGRGLNILSRSLILKQFPGDFGMSYHALKKRPIFQTDIFFINL